MADYAFSTTWHLQAPIAAVWEEIFHSERWPSWWRGLLSVVELAPGDALCIGCIRRFTWKGALPYTLVVEMRVTRVEPPTMLESRASGELEGYGLWSLASEGDVTSVRYNWNVRTTKRWMNFVTPLARPLFAWNHDVVMHGGEQGLRRLLIASEEKASVCGLGVDCGGDELNEGFLEDANDENARHESKQYQLGQPIDMDG